MDRCEDRVGSSASTADDGGKKKKENNNPCTYLQNAYKLVSLVSQPMQFADDKCIQKGK